MDEIRIMEEIMNKSYPGLTMLYRDANLGDFGDLYKKGMIIRERAFTDASKKGGGIITTHRFAIFSNNYLDASGFEQDTNWGLCIIQKGSYFKVLDIYERHGKTQIALLHLPEQYWWFFANVETNLDEQVVEYARKRFDECINTAPVPELALDNWLARCSFPLGMDDEGNFFPLRLNGVDLYGNMET